MGIQYWVKFTCGIGYQEIRDPKGDIFDKCVVSLRESPTFGPFQGRVQIIQDELIMHHDSKPIAMFNTGYSCWNICEQYANSDDAWDNVEIWATEDETP